MPKDQVDIHLRYEGPDVDDGTMSLQDAVPVLHGFASAYGKIAAIKDPSSTHKLRITAVRPGSVVFALDVWTFLNENANVISAAGVLATGASAIVARIIWLIRAKKHVRREPYREHIGKIQNTIILTNSLNVSLELPLEIYELFKAGTIDTDLNKIVSPLVPGHINTAEIEARNPDGATIKERIDASERPYFDTAPITTAKTQPSWLVVRLNSVTKTTNKGTVYFLDGTRASYEYVGNDPMKLYTLIAHDGPVRIWCVAYLDENLKPTAVDIYDLQKVQGELFPSDPTEVFGEKDE